MNLSWIILTIAGVINLGLISLIVRQKNALKKTVNITFILSVIFLLLWSLFNSMADNSLSFSSALFWTKMTFPASLFGLLAVLWFSYAFPIKIQNYKAKIIFYFFPVAIFSVLSMGKYVISGVELKGKNGISGISLGIIYPMIAAFYLLITINIAYNLYLKYRKTGGTHKAQIKYVIAGWGLLILGATATNLILPYFTGNADWSKFGPIFSIFMVGFITYAIIRHHLMDIRIVIQKGFIYTSLLVFIIGFYLASVFILGYLFQRVANITVLISAGLTVIIGVFGVPPLKRYFSRITDKIFFKDKYDYSQAIQELSEILNKNISLERIIGKTSKKFKEIMKTDKVVFSIIEQEKRPGMQLEKIGEGELSTKIVLDNKLIGKIILGKKMSGDPYTDEDVKLLRTFAYQAGVSIKRAELYEKMKNYSRELEEKVNQRTAKIEELQEEQKRTIMDISHGLQTPLTIIKSELGVLRRKNVNAENFSVLERSIDRISKFIYDLLRLARLETIEDAFKKETFSLSRLLKDLVDEFSIMAEEKNITIASDIATGIRVFADKSRIEELATNLVSNATKYISNEREILITLKKRNGFAELSIADTGIGISKKDLPNIFKRFYRIKENRHADTKGTGLGLAICKKIVEGHGGTIKAESETGKGTVFTITLPISNKKTAPGTQ